MYEFRKWTKEVTIPHRCIINVKGLYQYITEPTVRSINSLFIVSERALQIERRWWDPTLYAWSSMWCKWIDLHLLRMPFGAYEGGFYGHYPIDHLYSNWRSFLGQIRKGLRMQPFIVSTEWLHFLFIRMAQLPKIHTKSWWDILYKLLFNIIWQKIWMRCGWWCKT